MGKSMKSRHRVRCNRRAALGLTILKKNFKNPLVARKTDFAEDRTRTKLNGPIVCDVMSRTSR